MFKTKVSGQHLPQNGQGDVQPFHFHKRPGVQIEGNNFLTDGYALTDGLGGIVDGQIEGTGKGDTRYVLNTDIGADFTGKSRAGDQKGSLPVLHHHKIGGSVSKSQIDVRCGQADHRAGLCRSVLCLRGGVHFFKGEISLEFLAEDIQGDVKAFHLYIGCPAISHDNVHIMVAE